MRFVAPALFAEGPTDIRFLSSVLFRCVEEMLFARAVGNFLVSDVVELGESAGLVEPPTVVNCLVDDGEPFSLIFVHRDADARDYETKAAAWVDEVRRLTTAQVGAGLVFVIPVRMIEAWTFADGDALRSVLGVTWDDAKLGVPAVPAEVERIQDPKGAVSRLLKELSGPPVDLFARLGEKVDMRKLRAVPRFRELELQLAECLVGQGVIE